MAITGNFIFGDRAETLETANETLDYWKKNHDLFGTSISLGFIEPYPGTALYKHCLSKGLITDEIDFVENHIFFLLPHLSRREKMRRSLVRIGHNVLGDSGISYLRKIYKTIKML